MIPEIHIEEYNYPLPDERIAKYPLATRDSSKLLKYQDGNVTDHKFTSLPAYPTDAQRCGSVWVRKWFCSWHRPSQGKGLPADIAKY